MVQAPILQLVQPEKSRLDGGSLGAAQGRDMFLLDSLRTPPPDTQASLLKELDPFEDSPPRRPLSTFEDPTYIPPLTLTATLFDDYGLAASTLASATPLAADTLKEKHLASRAYVGTGPRVPAANSAGPAAAAASATASSLDLLGEFTATYNYLFGAPPSDAVTATFADTCSAPGAAGSGPLSPSSTLLAKAPGPDKASKQSTGQDSNSPSLYSGKSASSEDGDAASSTSTDRRDSEKRKEEERKATEMRNRRRQVLTQQVAFERMKERHRRQFPGQPAGINGSISRWQKEVAGATGPAHRQAALPGAPHAALHASCATIGRGGLQGATQQPPNLSQSCATLHPGWHAAAFPPGAAPAASRVAMAGYADPWAAHPWQTQAVPLLADPATSLLYGSPTSPMPGPPLPATAAPYHVLASPVSPERTPALPTISAHPVRLASTRRGAKNAYQSDSSGDDRVSSSSLYDSDDMSDASLSRAPQAMPRAVASSQPGSTRAPSDASSGEESGKSQSSSKRRVRFHETVAVVFNMGQPVSEDEDDGSAGALSDSGSDSESDSSSGPAGQPGPGGLQGVHAARQTQAAPSAAANGVCGADDAFDDTSAPGHLRYRIPSNAAPGANPEPQRLDGAAASREYPAHRIETQPLRDHEAEREQWRKGAAETVANDRCAPEWYTLPPSQGEQHRAPASGEVGDKPSAAVPDPVTEARRALLGHYVAPHPVNPVGSGIPRSGSMSPTLTRGSGVKVIGPQSFARSQGRAASSAVQQPKCTLPSPKHRLHGGKSHPLGEQAAKGEGHERVRDVAMPATPPTGQAAAGDVQPVHSHVGSRTFVAGMLHAGGPAPDDSQNRAAGVGREPDTVRSTASHKTSSDGDDIPLSTIARSMSEPLPSCAPESGEAKRQYRLLERLPKEQRRPVLVRNSSRGIGKDTGAVGLAAEARSASMDVVRHDTTEAAGAAASGKWRFHRWGNIL